MLITLQDIAHGHINVCCLTKLGENISWCIPSMPCSTITHPSLAELDHGLFRTVFRGGSFQGGGRPPALCEWHTGETGEQMKQVKQVKQMKQVNR